MPENNPDTTAVPNAGLDPLTPVLTRGWLSPQSRRRQDYEQLGGYGALKHAFAAKPEELVEMM
jgi:NADH-quinone oxidoreductase subunit F